MTADCITAGRILFSICLFAFSTDSCLFAVLYLLCGLSDALDGCVARKLHTESEKGAMLDSVADMLFAVVYAVKILPALSVPFWILIWIAMIAVTKTTGIMIRSKKVRCLSIEHSLGNRLTGLLLFLLPLSVYVVDVKYGAVLACIVATATVIIEITDIYKEREYTHG